MKKKQTWVMGLSAALLALAMWKVFMADRQTERVQPSHDDQADRPDPVDEAGAESFPASDPPSWAGR